MIRPGQPRKVVVATTIFDTYAGGYPGVQARLDEIESLLDAAVSESRSRYEGRVPDICILPEDILGNKGCASIRDRSFASDGPEVARVAAWARTNGTYVVLPFVVQSPGPEYRNSAALIDRTGEVIGVYHKMYPVVDAPPSVGGVVFEGGVAPGRSAPVFDTDFGRVGIQICFDVTFPLGWDQLTAGGAELVVWPTESPQRVLPANRAATGGYYVVSSTTRLNAAVFAPSGTTLAAVTENDRPTEASGIPGGGRGGWVLAQEIDLSYAVLNWSSVLDDGRLFDRTYGDRAGYAYDEEEDRGVFWSNDPRTPIERMASELGLEPRSAFVDRLRRAADSERTKL